MRFKYGDKVRPSTARNAYLLSQAFGKPVDTDTTFTVVLVCHDVSTHMERGSGVVVMLGTEASAYPYVWNEDRFYVWNEDRFVQAES